MSGISWSWCGDASVTHAGSKQGLVRIGPMRPSTPADGPATSDAAWRDWLGD